MDSNAILLKITHVRGPQQRIKEKWDGKEMNGLMLQRWATHGNKELSTSPKLGRYWLEIQA